MNKRIKKKLKTKRIASILSEIKPGVCYVLINSKELAQFEIDFLTVDPEGRYPVIYPGIVAREKLEKAGILLRKHETCVELKGVLNRVTKL